MPGLNRKSSYQTAESILDGDVTSLAGRRLKFLANAHLKVRERELSYLRENELMREQLDKISFRQHELESLRKEAPALRKENNRLKLLRTRNGLPVDAETARFALFGWRDYPQGGWLDFLSAHKSLAEAKARQKQTRTLFPFTHIANVEECDRTIHAATKR